MFKSKKEQFVPKPPQYRIKITTIDNQKFLGENSEDKEVTEERLIKLMQDVLNNSDDLVWIELDGQYIFADKIVSITVDKWQHYPPPRLY